MNEHGGPAQRRCRLNVGTATALADAKGGYAFDPTRGGSVDLKERSIEITSPARDQWELLQQWSRSRREDGKAVDLKASLTNRAVAGLIFGRVVTVEEDVLSCNERSGDLLGLSTQNQSVMVTDTRDKRNMDEVYRLASDEELRLVESHEKVMKRLLERYDNGERAR